MGSKGMAEIEKNRVKKKIQIRGTVSEKKAQHHSGPKEAHGNGGSNAA